MQPPPNPPRQTAVRRRGRPWSIRAALAPLLCLVCALGACRDSGASFDLQLARRITDLDAVDVPGSAQVIDGVKLREVRFSSRRWDADPAVIRIQAFVAVPPGSFPLHSKPAVVFAHGLGGQADVKTAIEMCRNLDVVALVLSGPGLGGSEGRALLPTDPEPLFIGHDDIRRNWLYAYVFAILRTITLAQTLPEVDSQAIALTGFSLGGIATLIANGVDDRIAGALPVAASGDLAAAAGQETWLRKLLLSALQLRVAKQPTQTQSGQPTPELMQNPQQDPGAQAFFKWLDPLAYAQKQNGPVYMLVGAQDEYFPLAQVLKTFSALRGRQNRLSLVPDYDHGWYFGTGCPARCMPGSPKAGEPTPAGVADCPPPPTCPTACPADAFPPYCGPQQSYNRQADFAARWSALLRALVANHVARPRRPFQPAPPIPRIAVRPTGVWVQPFAPASHVRLAISRDCGFTYSQTEVAAQADGSYSLALAMPPNAIVIAEVESEDGVVTTSLPALPPADVCRPRVRPFFPLQP